MTEEEKKAAERILGMGHDAEPEFNSFKKLEKLLNSKQIQIG